MNYYRVRTGVYIASPMLYPKYEQITEEEYRRYVPEPDTVEEPATEEDYEEALERFGVK